MQRSFVALTLLAIACSSATAGGSNVRVGIADPPESCDSIGKVKAYASNTENDDATVREKMRVQAESRGANYVRLDKLDGSNTLKEYTGTVYKCPPESLP